MLTNDSPPIAARPSLFPAPNRRRSILPLLLLFGVMGLTATGCGGCTQSPAARAKRLEDEAKKKAAEDVEKKKEKKELEVARLAVDPSDETLRVAVKQGHWATATQQMKANLDDFLGRVELAVVDKNGARIELDRTPYRLVSERPVALSKGRSKSIATTFFTPLTRASASIATKLQTPGGSTKLAQQPVVAKIMQPYQYHFVVLAKNPAKYTYVKTLDVVSFPNGGEGGIEGDNEAHYWVVLPKADATPPLSENPLCWSSIAYLLWDELEPDRLSLEQRDALIHWLHWGGQLIISGPDSLGLLRGSFLEPYLPVAEEGATRISQEQLDTLYDEWTPRQSRSLIPPLVAATEWSGVALTESANGKAVAGTGRLLFERRVGRGRIVVSAFQLDEPDFINWKAVGAFYNACLMRRPPRKWSEVDLGERLDWAEVPERRFDARLVSGLRYFTRDTGVETNFHRTERADNPTFRMGGFGDEMDEPEEWVAPTDGAGGVAAWNDFSKTARAARESLVEAAGVTVPPSSFVLSLLAVYLVVLVPLNWLFFHALGRVEWAWVAAPLIAVAGTMAVVWQAQLDIGFVRARTDIGIIELQGENPSAHVTQYTAVYTSLGTSYDFQFEDLTALAAPFPVADELSLLEGQTRSDVIFRKHEDVRLTGLDVSSNTTNMIHGERLFQLSQPIKIATSSTGLKQIVNGSEWELKGVAVVRREEDSTKLQGCWIGRMGPSSSALLSFASLPDGMPFAQERAAATEKDGPDKFSLDRLFDLALAPETMEPGEIRLVGRVDEQIPGLTVTPAASQTNSAALVVAHLSYGDFTKPVPDVNCRKNIVAAESADDEIE